MASSTEPAVAWIGPAKPALTSSGSRPQWSRWAWVSTTASRPFGSKPNGIRLRTDSFGLPWNMPQSIRTRARSVSRRNWEPVTVVAPPRKWICMAGHGDSPHVHRGIVASMPPPNPVTISGRLDRAVGE